MCVQTGIVPRLVRPGYEDLTPYSLLLAPSLHGHMPISLPAWSAVIDAVKAGTTLYVSGDGVSLTGIDRLFGITELEKLPLRTQQDRLKFAAGFECHLAAKYRHRFNAFTSEPLAWYSDGTPAMVKHRYGSGIAYFLSMPLESSFADTPFANEDVPAWKLYQQIRDDAGLRPPVDLPDPLCERYWNEDAPGHGWLTLINHRRESVEAKLESSHPITRIERSAGEAQITGHQIRLAPLQAVILEISLSGS